MAPSLRCRCRSLAQRKNNRRGYVPYGSELARDDVSPAVFMSADTTLSRASSLSQDLPPLLQHLQRRRSEET